MLAVQHEGHAQNEFDRLFELWNDVEYLRSFFQARRDELARCGRLGYEAATFEAREEAGQLEDLLWDFEEEHPRHGKKLASLFWPFHKQVRSGNFPFIPLELTKTKPSKHGFYYLRIYGVKVDDNTVIITSGGIKVVKATQDCPLLTQEVAKMEALQEFLKTHDINDSDQLKLYLYGNE